MFRLFRFHSKKLLSFFTSETFIYLAIIGNAALLIATLIFYLLEQDVNPMVNNYFDAFWWGVTTITTVGFGDVVPATTMGRIIGIVLMYSGTVLFVAFIGFLVSFWTSKTVEKEIIPLEAEVEEEEAIQIQILNQLKDIRIRLDRLEKRQR